MTSDEVTFPRMLRVKRLEKGHTQTQAAEACGVSQQLWGQLENGRSGVGPKSAAAVADYLGLSVLELDLMLRPEEPGT